MIIDGEKYACEACVRGHRVSNCQHSDRPLQHINKKGRPVSQCAHCRAMRKSRSAHVKCDCGIKPSKCIHLQPTLEGHTQTCCCNHGGACSCSHTHKPSPSSDASTPPQLGAGDLSQARQHTKLTSRARRASLVTSPTFPGVQKSITQPRASLKSRAPVTLARAGSLARRRRSSGTLHTLNGSPDHEASGDTTPDNSTEEPGSPNFGDVSGIALASHLPPLDMSRIARFSFQPPTGNAGFDLFNTTGFPDTDGPLFSAGLPTPSNMWGSMVTPTYNTMPPILAPSWPEILDDMGDLNFNFNDEFLAMGYDDMPSADKAAEYHQYWPPSP
ncbi:unnamed protein product [Parascedosporium putredinis]|uniref:Copper-fist domain-containing protein n=1 Tax=Parascedosporium putredinis TaxID=1442378 RepID=A0A9P1H4Y0_9PEZI|nr:unnamed protein product [Parascedosporium putredinis]CAI7996058.1 unnamed protein product [Parascedosporium putredinis]